MKLVLSSLLPEGYFAEGVYGLREVYVCYLVAHEVLKASLVFGNGNILSLVLEKGEVVADSPLVLSLGRVVN